MLINNNDQLKQFLVKSQKDNLIGVDTEFYRVSTYDPKLCLLQFSNRSQIMIVDPLNKKIDLELMKEILFSKKILKIFHAAYQDIEIIFNLFGKIPERIIDIQICLTELGYPNSTGYAEACKYSAWISSFIGIMPVTGRSMSFYSSYLPRNEKISGAKEETPWRTTSRSSG